MKEREVRLHKSDVFIILVTILKLVLMGLFSSDYQNELFIPFLSSFI